MRMPNVVRRNPWILLVGISLVSLSCGDDDSARTGSGTCTGCHAAEAAAWQNFSSHKGIYKTCTFCHEEADPEPGERHRTSPWCDQCHSEAGHPPPQWFASGRGDSLLFITCMTCHNPMGSENIYLIRERILVEEGRQVSVDFRNVEGRADFSYAELATVDGGRNGKEPGAGLCEVCHANTSVYNRTGTGGSHYLSRCAGCHNHAIGFGVEPACQGCHTEGVAGIPGSLQKTCEGMETWR